MSFSHSLSQVVRPVFRINFIMTEVVVYRDRWQSKGIHSGAGSLRCNIGRDAVSKNSSGP